MNMFTKTALAIVLSLPGTAAMAEAGFGKYDTNNDGVFTENEFNSYVDDAGLFSNWDADNDGFIEENEFNEVGLEGGYSTFDGNGDSLVDSTELYEGAYDSFDENENGHWEAGEWDDAREAGFFDV